MYIYLSSIDPMKKVILFALLIGTSLHAFGQISLQGNDTIYVSGPSSEFELVAYANVLNLSENPVDLRWVRLSNVLSPGWTSTICDVNFCYPDNTDSANFTMGGSMTGNLDAHFYLNGNTGEGTMRVRVFDVNNPSNALTITYIASATGLRASNLLKNSLKVYPVPAQDFLTVEVTQPKRGATAEIYNMIGKRVQYFSLKTGKTQVNVGQLPKGQYILRVYNGNDVITKNFIKL